jgi:hypothetical protein
MYLKYMILFLHQVYVQTTKNNIDFFSERLNNIVSQFLNFALKVKTVRNKLNLLCYQLQFKNS